MLRLILCPQIWKLRWNRKIFWKIQPTKATQEEVDNLLKKLNLSLKYPGPDHFTDEVYQIFKEVILTVYKLLQNAGEEICPNLFHEIGITLIPKPSKDIIRKKKLLTS